LLLKALHVTWRRQNNAKKGHGHLVFGLFAPSHAYWRVNLAVDNGTFRREDVRAMYGRDPQSLGRYFRFWRPVHRSRPRCRQALGRRQSSTHRCVDLNQYAVPVEMERVTSCGSRPVQPDRVKRFRNRLSRIGFRSAKAPLLHVRLPGAFPCHSRGTYGGVRLDIFSP
jgi:hypothetical protein